MKVRELPELEKLNKQFHYDFATGLLYRKKLRSGSFVLKEVGSPLNGYVVVGSGGATYYAHRIIWKMMAGEDFSGEIDHINGDRSDNRIENLRQVSKQENRKNRKRPKSNTTGHMGISWNKRSCAYRVRLAVNKKTHYLGYYKELDDAIKAWEKGREYYGFHKNHGRE